MFRLIKKSFILFILVTMDIIIYLLRIIYDYFSKNKLKIKNYAKSFKLVLKEELEK